MNTLSIEGWCKAGSDAKSVPGGLLHFRVAEEYHRAMETAEEALQSNPGGEQYIDVDMATLEFDAAPEYGDIADPRFRVYLGRAYQRGHFHLVARRASDDAMIYSNAVMIDQLG